jgi:3-deoxy-D-manno-octulosonic-acid transferase
MERVGQSGCARAVPMMRWVYSCLMWLAQPLLLCKLRQRALAEPGYNVAVQERFGYYELDGTAPVDAHNANSLVWVHAVSLGETRTAAILLAQLRQQLPDMRLLITHGTATGREQGRALLQIGDVQVWQPWDTPGAVGRFLTYFKPRIGVVLETEVWPNLVVQCQRARIPLCLVNARLNEKSLKKARRIGWLSRPAFAGLTAVWAQSHEDAQRLRQLGAPVRGVMGNFKFDATPDEALLEHGRVLRQASAKPVLMLASSREGEEQMLLQYIKKKWPQARERSTQDAAKNIATQVDSASPVQWLIVPRHPQRFDEVAALFESAGYTVARRSAWGTSADALLCTQTDILLGDSVGEMEMYFAFADVALLGGSFAPLGGQNLIEAAACGCPVVMGPHTFNFAQAAELAQAQGAAFAQSDLNSAVDYALDLIASPARLQAAKDAAFALGQAHRGAAQRTAQELVGILQE